MYLLAHSRGYIILLWKGEEFLLCHPLVFSIGVLAIRPTASMSYVFHKIIFRLPFQEEKNKKDKKTTKKCQLLKWRFTELAKGRKITSAGCSRLFVVNASDVGYMNIFFHLCYLWSGVTVNLLKSFH